jgi:TP901 family phage tail tape measure protein
MANRLLDLIAGLDVKGSAAEISKGLDKIKRDIPSLKLDFDLDAALRQLETQLRDSGQMTDVLDTKFKELRGTLSSIGQVSQGGLLLDKTEQTTRELKELQAQIKNINQGANIQILSKDVDPLGNLKAVKVQITDINGEVRKLNATMAREEFGNYWDFGGSMRLSEKFEPELKKIVADFKSTQKEIEAIEKKIIQQKATEEDFARYDQLQNQQLEKQINLSSALNNLREKGIISEERQAQLQKEQSAQLQKIISQSESRVQKVEGAEEYKAAKEALRGYEKNLKELNQIQIELTTNNKADEEALKSRRSELQKQISAQTELILKYEGLTEAAQKAETAIASDRIQLNQQEQSKLIESQLRDLRKMYKEEESLAKKASDAKLRGDEREEAALREKMALVRQNIQYEIRATQHRLTESAKLEEFEQRSRNQAIEQTRKLREAQEAENRALERREELVEKKYGSLVKTGARGQALGPIQPETMQDPAKVKELTKVLAGNNAELVKIADAKDRNGRMTRQLTIVEDKHADILKRKTYVYDEVTKSLRLMEQSETKNLRRHMGIISQLGTAVKHIATLGIAYQAIGRLNSALRETVGFVTELDKELVQVAIVQGKTRQSVQHLAEQYAETGIQLGKTADEISKVNTELVRQGLTLKESEQRMRTILQLSSTGMISSMESLKIITSAVNALQVSHERAADVILRSSQISASSVEELGEAFTKTASSAFAAGVEIEQMGAILSTLIEVTQEGPRQVGTSLKTILARFNRVNEETGEFNDNLNKVQQAVESVGISFTDADGQIRNTYDILADLSSIWGTLNKNQQAYVATQAAGVRQQNRFFAVMNNFNRVQAINNDLMNASGTLMKGQITYMTGLEAKANQLKATWQQLWVGEELEKYIHLVYDLGIAFIELIDRVGLVTTGLSGAAIVAVVKYGKSWKLLLDTLKQVYIVAGGGKLITSFQTLGASLAAIKASSVTTSVSLNYLKGSLLNTTSGVTMLTPAVTTMTAALGAANGVIMTMAAALAALGAVAVVAAGIGSFTKYLADQREEARKVREELAKLNNDYIELNKNAALNALEFEDAAREFSRLQAKVQMNTGDVSTSLNSEELREYYELNDRLLAIAPGLTTEMDKYGNQILKSRNSFQGLMDDYDKFINEKQSEFQDKSGEILGVVLEKHKDDLKESNNLYRELNKTVNRTAVAMGKMDEGWTISGAVRNEDLRSEVEIREDLNKILQENYESFKAIGQEMINAFFVQEDISPEIAAFLPDDFLARLGQAGENTEELAEELRVLQDVVKEENFDNYITDLQDLNQAVGQGKITNAEYKRQLVDLSGAIKDQIAQRERAIRTALAMGASEEDVARLYAEIEAYKTLFGVYEDGVISTESLYNSTQDLVNLRTNIKDYSDDIDLLQQTYNDLVEGQKLSAEQVADLTEKYPELNKYLREGYELNKDNVWILEELRDAKSEATLKAIEGSIAIAEANLIEARSAKSLDDTYHDLFKEKLRAKGIDPDSYSTSGFVRGQNDEIASMENDLAAMKALRDLFSEEVDESLEERRKLDSTGGTNTLFGIDFDKYDTYQQRIEETKRRLEELEIAIENTNKVSEKSNLLTDIKETREELVTLYEDLLAAKKENIESDQALLQQYGIINQAGDFAEDAAEKLANLSKEFEKNEEKSERLQEAYDNFKSYIADFDSLNDAIQDSNDELTALATSLYEQLEKAREEFEALSQAFDEFSASRFESELERVNYQISLLETIDPNNFERIDALRDRSIQVSQERIKALKEESRVLKDYLNTSKEYDQEWLDKADRLEQVTDQIRQSNLLIASTMREQYSSYIENIKSDIERLNPEPAAPELEKEVELNKNFLTDKERQIEVEKVLNDVNHNNLTLSREQLKILESQEALRKSELDIIKAELEVQKAQMRLENLREQNTIQELRKQQDGTWQFTYVADVEAIKEAKKELLDSKLAVVEAEAEMQDEIKKERDDAAQASYEDAKSEYEGQMELLNKVLENAENRMYKSSDEFKQALQSIGLSLPVKKMVNDYWRYFSDSADLLAADAMEATTTGLYSKKVEFEELGGLTGTSYGQQFYEALEGWAEKIEELLGKIKESAEGLDLELPEPAPEPAPSRSTASRSESGKITDEVVDNVNSLLKRLDESNVNDSTKKVLKDKLQKDFSEGKDLKDVKDWIDKAAQFDTGGYTGEFSGGKLGVLHEKEMVLNKIDTQNILKAVNIAKDFARNFQPQRAFVPETTRTQTTTEVYQIEKLEFPNITDASGLKEAFDQLPRIARQKFKKG